MPKGDKPIFVKRMGAISITGWENKNKQTEEIFKTGKISRSYKKRGSDEWKDKYVDFPLSKTEELIGALLEMKEQTQESIEKGNKEEKI